MATTQEGSDPEPIVSPAADSLLFIVGPCKTVSAVHERIIDAHSPVLAAAAKESWRGFDSNEVELPDDDEKTFSDYVSWLYTSTLYGFHWSNANAYDRLFKLYVLADKLLDSECKDRTIETILGVIWDQHIGDFGKCLFPSVSEVHFAYNNTTTDSPLRQIIVELHVYEAKSRMTGFLTLRTSCRTWCINSTPSASCPRTGVRNAKTSSPKARLLAGQSAPCNGQSKKERTLLGGIQSMKRSKATQAC
ncbi:hypothetical protein BAUCODRAFT_21148 [Baudoinia panamericana UAMH 10762]|uniref:BTB domain-containing protein n=1 Tax=Baudoinia panamericana (strain UAMH 10762) TaxID=717646 RepID=M2NNV5_BAUPA|nr:uncharacterized protein BAUCODRAFT_21148 [Baudoinia panamericana UAMH 10762]EMD01220.1 hypothetical protein BAUCODRAFT_21148 [Baudoinia panamericana UAMH 10762]